MTGILIKKKFGCQRTQREDTCVTTEAEMGVMQWQAKDGRQLLTGGGGATEWGPPLGIWQGVRPCPPFDI